MLKLIKSKTLSFCCAIVFFVNIMVGHQNLAYSLDIKSTPILTSPTVSLTGIYIDPLQPFRLDFIVDSKTKNFDKALLSKSSLELIKYFLAAFSVPDKNMWVNLSPYEKNRIISPDLGKTQMGLDLLASDYLLKKLSSSLLNPLSDIGKKFWKEVYLKAVHDASVNTRVLASFNKVWILPDKAEVYLNDNHVYIKQMHLKVMLDKDYEVLNQNNKSAKWLPNTEKLTEVSSQIIQEIIIPELTREVNESPDFENLRQIVRAVILASWYKKHFEESIISRIFADQQKVKGFDIKEVGGKEKIFNNYVRLFRKGSFNFIHEDYDPETKRSIPRKYFSGGFIIGDIASNPTVITEGQLPQPIGQRARVTVDLAMVQEGEGVETPEMHPIEPVKVQFTSGRVHSMKDLKPGQIMINAGRENRIEIIDGKVKGIKDHHHLGRNPLYPQGATDLIFRDAEELRTAGKIDTVITNYNPDFDTIVAIMTIDLLRTLEHPPTFLPSLVQYVTMWDSGTAYRDGSQEERLNNLRNSLGALIRGVLSLIDSYPKVRYFASIEKQHGFTTDEQLAAANLTPELRTEINNEINTARSLEKVAVVREMLNALFNNENYNGPARNFLVTRDDFPARLHELYDEAKKKVDNEFNYWDLDNKPLNEDNQHRGIAGKLVPLKLFIDNNHNQPEFTNLSMPFFKNPRTKDFYFYLYLTGGSSGIIYGTREKKDKKIGNIPLDQEVLDVALALLLVNSLVRASKGWQSF